MRAGELPPPIVPEVLSSGDASNFSVYTESADVEVPPPLLSAEAADGYFRDWLCSAQGAATQHGGEFPEPTPSETLALCSLDHESHACTAWVPS